MSTQPFPRHREEDNILPLILNHTVTRCDGSSYVVEEDCWNDFAGGYKLGNGTRRETNDVVVPNYRERSAAGEVFMNPFRSEITKYSCASISSHEHHWVPTCSGTSTKSVAGNTSYGGWGGFLTAQPGWVDQTRNLRELAGTEAWANVTSPEVLGGEFLRDAGRTLSLVTNPLRELRNVLSSIRSSKGYRKKGLTLGQYISSEWLKYRYGITPLVHDCVGAFEAVYKPIFTDRVTARGYENYPLYEATDTVTKNSIGGIFTCVTERYASQAQSVRAGVLYQHVAGMPEKFGIHFNQLVPTLWEILPGSFVSDWFVNVGDYLAAVTPRAGITVLSSWTTTKVVHTQRSVMSSTPNSVSNVSQTGGPGIYGNTERIVTIRTPGAPRSLAIRSNDWTLSKSKTWFHAADAFALIGGLLASKPGRRIATPPPSRVRARPRSWASNYDVYWR